MNETPEVRWMGKDPGNRNVSLGAIRPYILGESLF